jgi:tetratricopeptide (TPR) repeat protein
LVGYDVKIVDLCRGGWSLAFSGRLKVRGRATRFGLAVSTVAAATGGAALAVWPRAWPWLVTATVLIAAGAPPAAAALSGAQQRRTQAGKVVRQALRGTTGVRLPLVKDAPELDSLIARAVLPIPYIKRDVESEAELRLAASRPVLLVGSSMTGKTYVAVTLVRRIFRECHIVIPDHNDALMTLDAADVVYRGSVVFLDDLDRFLAPGNLTAGLLNRLIGAGNIIIGTMRSSEYDRYRPTDKYRSPEWQIISIFERVFMQRQLSRQEDEWLESAVADSEIRNRIRRVGIGEYAGAAQQIAEALKLGSSVNPIGYALVRGVADWHRSGMTRYVPGALLRDLAAPYLDARRLANLRDTKLYQEGLAWAMREINPTVSLIQQTGEDVFTVYEYVLELLSVEAEPLPDTTWRLVIENSDADELITVAATAAWKVPSRRKDIAIEAYQAAIAKPGFRRLAIAAFGLGVAQEQEGNLDAAHDAYQFAIDAEFDEAYVHILARLYLAALLRKRKDFTGAQEVLQQLIDGGDDSAAAYATFKLGEVFLDIGDLAAAKRAFQEAITAEDPESAELARIRLAMVLRDQGDFESARKELELVMNSEEPERFRSATAVFGDLLTIQGDFEGARRAYQIALESTKDATFAAGVANSMAGMLEAAGNESEAFEYYRRASESNTIEQRSQALINMGDLLTGRDDVSAASDCYRRVIDLGHSDLMPSAAVKLGALLVEDDVVEARRVYKLAIDSGHIDCAPAAAICLGISLSEEGDIVSARAAYEQAMESGHREYASAAAITFAELLESLGDNAAAVGLYRRVIDWNNESYAPVAMAALGVLLQDESDLEAIDMLRQAMASRHESAAPNAAFNFGVLLEEKGDIAGSKEAYRFVIGSDHVESRAAAAFNLGLIFRSEEEWNSAKEAFQYAVDSGHAEYAPIAAVSLANTLLDMNDKERALELYRQICNSGSPEAASLAALNMGRCLEDEGDAEGARTAYERVITSGHPKYSAEAHRLLEEL